MKKLLVFAPLLIMGCACSKPAKQAESLHKTEVLRTALTDCRNENVGLHRVVKAQSKQVQAFKKERKLKGKKS